MKGHLKKPAMKLELSCSLGVSRPLTVPFVGVLDSVTDGLTFAMSLDRKLLSSYSGDAFLVRANRSGQPTYGAAYKADGTRDTAALQSFFAGSDTHIVTPYNQCGSGLVMTQVSGSIQPKIATAGTLEDGAKCTSSNEAWKITLTDILDLISSNQGQFFMKFQPANDAGNVSFMLGGPSGMVAYLPYVALGNVYFDWVSADRIQATTPAGLLDTLSTVSLEKDATVARMRINGSVVASGAATGVISSGAYDFIFPAGSGMTGYIRELVVWKTCDATTAAARYAALTA